MQQRVVARSASRRVRRFKEWLTEHGYLPAVLIIAILVGSQLSPYFLTSRNITNLGITVSVYAILAVGEFLVIVTGGIDLSVGSTVALSSVVAAQLMQAHWGAGWSSVAALAVGGAVGFFNAFGIVVLGITPFIVTLASLGIVSGLAYVLQSGTYVGISNNAFVAALNGTLGSVSVQIVYFVAIALIAGWVMRYTAYGRRLYALGGNRSSARLSGLPVMRDTVSVYVIAGVLAAFGGLLLAAELAEGNATLGNSYELDAIAAVVVGGASLFGGTGDPISAVVGALVLGIIEDVMDLRGVAAEPQLIVRGLVILVAVTFTGGRLTSVSRQLLGRSVLHRSARTDDPTTPDSLVDAEASGRKESSV
jgi:ribose transport system permease protein